MNRRDFLKAIGVMTGGIYVPEFQLILPETPIPEPLEWFGTVREIFAYDLRSDELMMRHDILAKSKLTQLHLDHRLRSGDPYLRDSILEARKTSELLLFEAMKERNIKISDLIALPPIDYLPIPEEVAIALGYSTISS